jgi:ribonuclease D
VSRIARDVALVDTSAAWRATADELRGARRVALDLEADGFHRYPERVALLQIALPDGRIRIVDPLPLDGLDALGDVLADDQVTKVLHSAGFDVRSLDRDFGFHVRGLFDTAIAAQFCGSTRTGLANVMAEYEGITMAKPKRYQRHDWSARPLCSGAVAYAADDVRYLFALADTLSDRLRSAGRSSWVAEECRRLEQVRFQPPASPDESWMVIRGAKDLTSPARAVLRELNVFREAEARRAGRPPYRILPNRALLELAARPSTDLEQLPGINKRALSSARGRLTDALQRGRAAEPIPWPRRRPNGRWSRQAQWRLKALKAWRSIEASHLGLDVGVVWPADHLKAIAVHPDRGSRQLDEREETVRDWQWKVLGASLDDYRQSNLSDVISPIGPAD